MTDAYFYVVLEKGRVLDLQLSSKFSKGKAVNVRLAEPQQSNGCSVDLTEVKPALKIDQGQAVVTQRAGGIATTNKYSQIVIGWVGPF